MNDYILTQITHWSINTAVISSVLFTIPFFPFISPSARSTFIDSVAALGLFFLPIRCGARGSENCVTLVRLARVSPDSSFAYLRYRDDKKRLFTSGESTANENWPNRRAHVDVIKSQAARRKSALTQPQRLSFGIFRESATSGNESGFVQSAKEKRRNEKHRIEITGLRICRARRIQQ